MPGQQREHDGGVATGAEISPIHGHIDASTGSRPVGNPVARCRADIDSLVGQQPLRLLDRMLGHQAARQGEALANRIDPPGKRS